MIRCIHKVYEHILSARKQKKGKVEKVGIKQTLGASKYDNLKQISK